MDANQPVNLGVGLLQNIAEELSEVGIESHFSDEGTLQIKCGKTSGDLIAIDGDFLDMPFSVPRTATIKTAAGRCSLFYSKQTFPGYRIGDATYIRGEGDSVSLAPGAVWAVPLSFGIADFPAEVEDQAHKIENERQIARANRDRPVSPPPSKESERVGSALKPVPEGGGVKFAIPEFGMTPQWVTRSVGDEPSVWAKLSEIEQRVYIALVGRSDRDHGSRACWPSQTTIMRESGVKKRSNVSKATKLLAEKGLIRKETKQRGMDMKDTMYWILENPPRIP